VERTLDFLPTRSIRACLTIIASTLRLHYATSSPSISLSKPLASSPLFAAGGLLTFHLPLFRFQLLTRGCFVQEEWGVEREARRQFGEIYKAHVVFLEGLTLYIYILLLIMGILIILLKKVMIMGMF